MNDWTHDPPTLLFLAEEPLQINNEISNKAIIPEGRHCAHNRKHTTCGLGLMKNRNILANNEKQKAKNVTNSQFSLSS